MTLPILPGMNGCFHLYQGRDVKPSKKNDLKDQMLVLAPMRAHFPLRHLPTCRKNLMNNMKIQSAFRKPPSMAGGKSSAGTAGMPFMSIFNPSGKQ